MFEPEKTGSVLLSPNSSSMMDIDSDTNWTLHFHHNLSDVCAFLYLNSTDSIRKLLADQNCFRHSTEWTIFLCLMYYTILICGLVGNSLVIFVVLWKPRMRTVTNMFILNLAVADLFVIVFCVPATLLANVFIPWILGGFMCSAVAYIQGVSIFSSVYSLVAVSVDRCRAIYRPMDVARGLSKLQAFVFIVLIWFIAILITLPWYYVFHIVHYPETGQVPFCTENWPDEAHGKFYFFFVHLLLCFCSPLILIVIFNSIIWNSVSSRQIPLNLSSSSSNANSLCHIYQMHRMTKIRVLKMLTLLTIAFCVCWGPLYTIMARLKFFGVPSHPSLELDFIEVFIPLAQLLGSSNSCLNPILYGFLNRKFRDALKSLLDSFNCFGLCNTCGDQQRPSCTVSWRRSPNGNHHTRIPASPRTMSNVGLDIDRTVMTPRSSISFNWSRSPSPSPNLQRRPSPSPSTSQRQLLTIHPPNLAGGHGSSFYINAGQGTSLSHSKECMCTNF